MDQDEIDQLRNDLEISGLTVVTILNKQDIKKFMELETWKEKKK